MKLSQKKTCEGCKAFYWMGCGQTHCDLGYKQEGSKPLEPCPKPTTNTALCNCVK